MSSKETKKLAEYFCDLLYYSINCQVTFKNGINSYQQMISLLHIKNCIVEPTESSHRESLFYFVITHFSIRIILIDSAKTDTQ